MNKNSAASGGGIGFLGLLALIFITLKLTSVIDWPWIFVIAPLWPALFFIGLFLVLMLVLAVDKILGYWRRKK